MSKELVPATAGPARRDRLPAMSKELVVPSSTARRGNPALPAAITDAYVEAALTALTTTNLPEITVRLTTIMNLSVYDKHCETLLQVMTTTFAHIALLPVESWGRIGVMVDLFEALSKTLDMAIRWRVGGHDLRGPPLFATLLSTALAPRVVGEPEMVPLPLLQFLLELSHVDLPVIYTRWISARYLSCPPDGRDFGPVVRMLSRYGADMEACVRGGTRSRDSLDVLFGDIDTIIKCKKTDEVVRITLMVSEAVHPSDL